jgi:uncharacterized protein (DUF1800 family)
MQRWAMVIKGALVAALSAALAGCPIDGAPPTDKPQSRADAWRFLTHATFGPDEASIQRVTDIGYSAWIDEQFALTPTLTYRAFMTQRGAELKADALGGTAKAGAAQMLEAFYTRALSDKAQLRSRLAFVLSQLFVVSMVDETLGLRMPEMVAGHMDMLESGLSGNYRQLIESVAKDPAMGQFLTFRGNVKEYPALGHFPDENFAREIMQLFSIGLYELNPDGTQRLGANGRPIETYTSADVKGLAKVFTGWGNYRGPAYAAVDEGACFSWSELCRDVEGAYHPMVTYPAYHSTSEKAFLGVTVPAQGTPDPDTSLRIAMDRLATHPNTAPFFSKHLIQQLVTSNPSPAYVARVAASFTASGGNIKETVKAVLLDDEAKGSSSLLAPDSGKLREPVLRMTAVLRAFGFNAPSLSVSRSLLDGGTATQRTPYVSIGYTTDPASSLGQTPLHAPSVFNFFRPGYTPPQSKGGTQMLVEPEMQLVNETSVTGYVNAMADMLSYGIGPSVVADSDGQCGVFTAQVQQYIQSLDAKVAANKALQTAAAACALDTQSQRNVTLLLADQRSVATDPAAITQRVADRLLGGSISIGLSQLVNNAVLGIVVPPLNAAQTNGSEINAALDKRTWTAILMVAVSPEFLVTK